MKSINLLLILSLFAGTVSGQKNITKYFDENWNEVDTKGRAVYYRIAQKTEDKRWQVKDYYMNGNIQMTGFFKSKREKNRHGKFVYYYENGNKSSEGVFVKDKKSGDWRYFYENSLLKSRVSYKEGHKTYEEVYYRNGLKKHQGGFWQSGVKKGTWKFWNDQGHLFLEGAFKIGRRDGKWLRYFPDGNEMKLRYRNGILLGAMPGGVIKKPRTD